MTLMELLCFVLALAISIVSGRLLLSYISWWSVLPAMTIGFGMVYVGLVLFHKFVAK